MTLARRRATPRAPRSVLSCALLALAPFALAACGDDAPTAGGDSAQVTIRLSQATASAAITAAFATDAAPGAPMAGNVARPDVAALSATLVGVQLARSGADEDGEDGWVTFTLAEPVELDLMALPSELDQAIVVDRGDLPAGTYRNLRLQVVDTRIAFARDIEIGPRMWAAEELHPLRIAGPAQSVLKIPTASYELEDDESATIDIVFEAGTTIGSITANPQFVIANPVLTGRVRK